MSANSKASSTRDDANTPTELAAPAYARTLAVPTFDDAAVAALRSDLAVWTFEASDAVLGEQAQAALLREHRVPALLVARTASKPVPSARPEAPADFAPLRGPAAPGDPSSPADSAADLDASTRRRVALLCRLFLLGDALTRGEVAEALPQLGVDRAVSCGLVAAVDDEEASVNACPADEAGRADEARPAASVAPADAAPADPDPTASAATAGASPTLRALVDIRPVEGTWLLSDLGQTATGQPLRPDHVLGAGGASYALARMTIRRPAGRVLDVGTGAGVQALLAARHADHVLATDISERALALADISLRLAGLTPGADFSLRVGSMLEPAAGEQFDLVVSNPPFVITPDAVRGGLAHEETTAPEAPGALGLMEYRDGGRRGDDIVADLARTVADLERGVLAPGGVAQFLGNWELGAGEDWRERVGAWIPDGIDAWVVQREELDPAAYVETWLRDGGVTPEADREGFEAAYALWLGDFHRRGITRIGMGSVTLRRPATPLDAGQPAWRRFEEVSTSALSPGAADTLGSHIAQVLDVVAELRARGVDPNAGHTSRGRSLDADTVAALADVRFIVGPDVTEERHYRPGAQDPNLVTLHQGGGYGRNRQVDTLAAAFVGASDGELTLEQIAGALAALLGQDDDAAAITAQLAEVAVELLLEGFLTLGS